MVTDGIYVAEARLMNVLFLFLGVLTLQRSPAKQIPGLAAGAGMMIAIALLASFFAPMEIDDRFAGGTLAYAHPNLIGLFATFVALTWLFVMDIGWLRVLGVAALVAVLISAESRTSIGCLGVGFLAGVATWRMRAVLLVGVVAVFVLGSSFFLSARSDDTDVYTGRLEIWEVGLQQWRSAGAIGKLLGPGTGIHGLLELADGREFVAHNAFVNALIRGGVIGVLFAAVGVLLLLIHARFFVSLPQTGVPQAALAFVAAGLATVQTEAFLSDGTLLWWIAAGEALLVARSSWVPAHRATTPVRLARRGAIPQAVS
jgi:O-antigen ligase